MLRGKKLVWRKLKNRFLEFLHGFQRNFRSITRKKTMFQRVLSHPTIGSFPRHFSRDYHRATLRGENSIKERDDPLENCG